MPELPQFKVESEGRGQGHVERANLQPLKRHTWRHVLISYNTMRLAFIVKRS